MANNANNIGIRFTAEGDVDFRNTLKDINQNMRLLGSEMKLAAAEFDSQDKSVEALNARNETLNKGFLTQKAVLAELVKEIEASKDSFGESGEKAREWQIKLNNAQLALNSLERGLIQNNQALESAKSGFIDAENAEQGFSASIEGINQNIRLLGSEMKTVASSFGEYDGSVAAALAKNSILTKEIDAQKEKIALLGQALKNSAESFGENDKRTQTWAIQLNNAKTELNGMVRELSENERNIRDVSRGYDDAGNKLDSFGRIIEESTEKASIFGDVLKAGFVSDMVGGAVRSLGNTIRSFIADGISKVNEELENQAKLSQVMKNTMDAVDGEVQAIIKLTEAQERLGVVSSTTQQAGAQELGTYLQKSETLKTLIPVMNDVLAQQYGLNASSENAVTIATMLGKVMDGQTGALSRYGYSFTDAQAQILKFGTETERAAVLADVVTASVGGMNKALGETDAGKAIRAGAELENMQKNIGQAANELQSTLKAQLLPAIEEIAVSVSDFIADNKESLREFAEIVGGLITFVLNNAGYVASGIAGIGAAYATLKVASVLNGITAAHGALTAAAIAQTVAQGALNAVTMSFPGAIIAVAIGGLVTAAGGLVTAMNNAKKAQEEFNAAVADYNRLKLEGITRDEIYAHEQNIAQMETLKKQYSDILNLAHALKEDTPGKTAKQAMLEAADVLGTDLKELEKQFKDYGVVMRYVGEGAEFTAIALDALNERIETERMVVGRASIDLSRYAGELDDTARREIENNKALLESHNDLLNARLDGISESIKALQAENAAEYTSQASAELNRQKIAELSAERKRLGAILNENIKTIEDLIKIENGEYEQTMLLTDANAALTESWALLSERVTQTTGDINKLERAHKTLQDGGSLSIEQLLEFIELYPEVAGYIAETSDLTLKSGEIFAIVANEKRQALIAEMETQAESTRAIISNLESQARAAQLSYAAQISAIEGLMEAQDAAARLSGEAKEKSNADRERIAEQQRILAEQEAKINALKNIRDWSGSTGASKSVSSEPAAQKENNALLDAERERLAYQKRLGELSAREELDWEILIAEQYAKSDKERADAKIRIFDAINNFVEQEMQGAAKLREIGMIDAEGEIARINAIQAEYEALIETHGLSAVKAADISGSMAAAIKAVYQEEYDAIQHAKNMGDDTGRAMLEWYDKAIASGAYTAKECIKLAEERYKEETRLGQSAAAEINKLGGDLTKALMNQYTERKNAAIQAIDDEVAAVKSASWEKIREYDAEYAAKLKLINDEESARLSAIQAEIDAIDEKTRAEEKARKEKEYNDKLAELQAKFKDAATTKEKEDIQREVNRLAEARQREVTAEQRNAQKEFLKQQLEDEKAAMKAAREELEESKLTELEARKQALNKQFDELMSAEAIQAEALKLMVAEQQDDLIALLESYYPSWNNVGKNFSDYLMDGLNPDELTRAAGDVLGAVNAAAVKNISGISAGVSAGSISGTSDSLDTERIISAISDVKAACVDNRDKQEPLVVNINLNNPVVRKESDFDEMMKLFSRELTRVLNARGRLA